jgi:sugar lactone lactonase YvrE
MNAPSGVCSDGTALFVVDVANNRVLGWKALPTLNGQVADVVLGQADGASVSANRGTGGATAGSLSLPSGCAVVSGALLVADTGNNRVLRYSTPTAASGAAADKVLGQADLTSRIPAPNVSDLAHLAGPIAITTDGANLYVVDRDLARVVVYHKDAVQSGGAAAEEFGGNGGAAGLLATGGVAAQKRPLFTSTVFVSDALNNRIASILSVSRLLP